MRNECHQKVNRNVAKHDAQDLAETESLTPELDDVDNNSDNHNDIFEGRDESKFVLSGQKAHQRQAQLLNM